MADPTAEDLLEKLKKTEELVERLEAAIPTALALSAERQAVAMERLASAFEMIAKDFERIQKIYQHGMEPQNR